MRSVIWQTSDGERTSFELEYITRVLLDGLSYTPHHDGGKCGLVMDESLIVYSCDEPRISPVFARYLSEFDRAGYRYWLLHLSNESLKHRADYYARAVHVFRGYHDPKIRQRNVTTIPIGFKSGFYHPFPGATPSATSRQFVWSFIGQLKSDRQEMYDAFRPIDPAFVHLTSAWACASSLAVDEVVRIYEQTLFVPCPMGFCNPDSFRVCEALECGCVPILRMFRGADYFTGVFGSHPMPVVPTWSDGARLASELARDRARAETLRTQVTRWYEGFRDRLRVRVREIVAGSPSQ